MTKPEALASAARCGEEAARVIATAIATPVKPEWPWDLYVEHAMRMAKIACFYAFKARPDLRPPDRYDAAVADGRRIMAERGWRG